MTMPSVSIIIPVYNGAGTIVKAIETSLAQVYAGTKEVVIVDDGSTDNTSALVASYPVVYLRQENAGPASARNLGAKHAQGDIFIFTDADCCPEPGWLEKLMAGFSSNDTGAVCGSYAIANPQEPLARVIHDEILFRHHRLMPEFPRAFGSYNVAIRSQVFRAVGGFNAMYLNASGEDNDLSYKILAAGHKIRFLREARVAHYHQTKVSQYLKEQFRHGVWRVKMYADHAQMISGDDYTFWKDIIEPPCVLLVFLFCAIKPDSSIFTLSAFFFFELVFAIVMMREARDVLLAGCIFFLRAFARTFGFLLGGILLLTTIIKKGKKNLRGGIAMLI